MIIPQQISQSFASHRLVPEFVQQKYGTFSGTTTFTVTLDTSPTEGNFIVLLSGGSQTRTPTMTGFTTVNLTSGGESNYCGYKFAGAGESATITVTWNANLQGSLVVMEFRHIDPSPVVSGTGSSGAEFDVQTAAQYVAFNVPHASVYLLSMAVSDQNAWSVDSGYTNITALSRFYPARKIYSSSYDAEAPIWSGVENTGNYAYIGFNGKRI